MGEMVKLTGVILSPSSKVMVISTKKPRRIPIISFTWGQRKEGTGKTLHRKRLITGGRLKCGKN